MCDYLHFIGMWLPTFHGYGIPALPGYGMIPYITWFIHFILHCCHKVMPSNSRPIAILSDVYIGDLCLLLLSLLHLFLRLHLLHHLWLLVHLQVHYSILFRFPLNPTLMFRCRKTIGGPRKSVHFVASTPRMPITHTFRFRYWGRYVFYHTCSCTYSGTCSSYTTFTIYHQGYYTTL